jgi:acyl-coenzyme A synthetase/AMP-(fatty) acid ligase
MIIDRIYESALTDPAKPALIHDDFVIDYATFAKGIETFRKILQQKELPAGTIAVVLVSHLADAWAITLALRALGLTTIQLRSIAHIKELGLKNVSCAVTTEREQSEHDLAGNAFAEVKIIVVLRAELAATQLGEIPVAPQAVHPAGGHILYTSGSTGDFKKVMWDSQLEDVRSSARSRCHSYDNAAMVHNLNFELFTGIGWKVPLSVWQAGGCVIIDQGPERYERFFRHPVTHTRMSPYAFRYLVEIDNDRDPPNGCEIWVSGGVMGDLASKALERFRHPFSIYHHYSATELITPPLISRLQNPSDAIWLCPVPDRTVQIVDETGRECSPGQEGDLRIRTTELDWQCFLDDEEATSKVFRDGFLYPGDRAVRRADGRIRIVGRIADVLNVQGEKIPTGPIEQRIRQSLGANEVCVFSGLNAAGQNELVIAIETDREPAKEKLDSIRGEFDEFDKVRFSILREFPRTEAGTKKIRRAALRTLVFSEPDSMC